MVPGIILMKVLVLLCKEHRLLFLPRSFGFTKLLQYFVLLSPVVLVLLTSALACFTALKIYVVVVLRRSLIVLSDHR